MTIKITFLGTSGAIPTTKKNHTGIFLNYKSENILIDCGEGIQRQFKFAKISPLKLTRLLITHWHGDHVLGIPGLLQTLSFSDYRKNLKIYGPKGLRNNIKNVLKAFPSVKNVVTDVKIKVEEISKNIFLETDDFYLEAKRMKHGIITLAYNFVEKDKLKLNKRKLEKTKLPKGPLLKRLKEGKDIIYKGKKYEASDLTYGQKGRKISIVLDTGMDNDISNFVKDADLLIIESTYASDLKEIAQKHKHLTATQAAQIAEKAKVKKLILTHLSQRYDKDKKKILNEAKKVFKNSFLVEDLDVVEI